MTQTTRLEVIQNILSAGLLPLFYHPDHNTAAEIVNALVEGGVQVVEFTNRGEAAYPVFTELVRQFRMNSQRNTYASRSITNTSRNHQILMEFCGDNNIPTLLKSRRKRQQMTAG